MNVKAAVSIPEPVFEEAEKLARKMKVSRSRLYSLALESYLGDLRNRRILEQANAAFDAPPSSGEDGYLDRMKAYRRRTFKEDW